MPYGKQRHCSYELSWERESGDKWTQEEKTQDWAVLAETIVRLNGVA